MLRLSPIIFFLLLAPSCKPRQSQTGAGTSQNAQGAAAAPSQLNLADQEAENALLGKWMSPCLKLTSSSTQVLLNFTKSNAEITAFSYLDPDCSVPMSTQVGEFASSYVGKSTTRTDYTVTLKLYEDYMTYESKEAVDLANSNKWFSITNWAMGTPRNVTKLTNTPGSDQMFNQDVSTTVFTITVDDQQRKTLMFADPNPTLLGIEFNTTIYFADTTTWTK